MSGLGAQLLAEPGDVFGLGVGVGLEDDGGTCRGAHCDQMLGLDGALAHRRVAVPRGTELVTGVIAVHEVDPASDGHDPVDYADQILPGGERVAGIQAEPTS